ncbi:hypothetical protein MRB53_009947 [Persea americana]|uniref:Uncharacterized protein n=1 Tax=Persea americana TaxID=3435 RepID=A0ACC2LQN7_PERAE|nr:hypothetical protein MRB53_009947 [Persea americana]
MAARGFGDGSSLLLRQRARLQWRRQCNRNPDFCFFSGLQSAMAHKRSEPISFLQHEIRTLPVAFSGLLLGEDDRARTSTPVVQQQAKPKSGSVSTSGLPCDRLIFCKIHDSIPQSVISLVQRADSPPGADDAIAKSCLISQLVSTCCKLAA